MNEPGHGIATMVSGLRGRIGLAGRLLAIVLFALVADFAINTVVFERAADFTVREEEAERMAEHLVIARRVIGNTPAAGRAAAARQLSTERFAVDWSPAGPREVNRLDLATLRRQVLGSEPELADADVRLHLRSGPGGGAIAGSLLLPDQSAVTFRSDSHLTWKLNLGLIARFAVPSILVLGLAWLLLITTLRPLRGLVRATATVGAGNPTPIREAGQAEVRHLIRAFNSMQERIHQLLVSRTQTMLAIGHDLRTPLARLQLRLDEAALDPVVKEEMATDLAEMTDLLASLQAFVESGDDRSPPERIDVAAMARTQIDNARDRGRDARYSGPDSLEMTARPVQMRRAISNLIQNALHYAGDVRVIVREAGTDIDIIVEDTGPGIPADRLGEVLRPFARLDFARARNTGGMGLGLAIVERAARAQGGRLILANRPAGGLSATIRVPRSG